MDNSVSYVIGEDGKKYIVIQEIEENGIWYCLTRNGVYEKGNNNKGKLASKEINEKYLTLLETPKIDKYIIVEDEREL